MRDTMGSIVDRVAAEGVQLEPAASQFSRRASRAPCSRPWTALEARVGLPAGVQLELGGAAKVAGGRDDRQVTWW